MKLAIHLMALAVGLTCLLMGIYAVTSRRPEERETAPGWLVTGAGLILVGLFA